MSSFEHLVEIARQYQTTQSALPEKTDKQVLWTGIGFNLLGDRFVASMGEVIEMMPVPQYTKLPGVKNFVTGVANVRGRLMTLIDMTVFFGERSRVPRVSRRVLVVDEDGGYFGFIVDESLGMQHFPQDGFSRQTGQVQEQFRSYLLGSYRVAGNLWPVISLHTILADPKLDKLAA
ncbi:MAG: chemotaxis protein CheW [Gammaproteobacteria bacterium]|nr:chemotaxis protein CheW [Gammaproteobacteria bacterium]